MACALAMAALWAAAASSSGHRGDGDGDGDGDGPWSASVQNWLEPVFAAVLPAPTVVFDATASTADIANTADTANAAAAWPELNDGRSAIAPRWRRSLQAFALDDRTAPPPSGGVVFVGSSSIGLWNSLGQQFPAHNVIRRGLGGAQMADCAHHTDRLVLPYKPRLVVVYAGDNDLAQGVAPQAVLAGFIELARRVHQALPDTRVAFVSIKPSVARAALLPLVRQTNALLAEHIQHRTQGDAHHPVRLHYIDVFTPMLNAQGQPRPELFIGDALHLNAAGYAVWQHAIGPYLKMPA